MTSELILKRGRHVDIRGGDSRQNEWQMQRPWGRISLCILGVRGRLVGPRMGNKEGHERDRIREAGRGHDPWRVLLRRRRAEREGSKGLGKE